MGLTTLHPELEKYKASYERCNDTADGQDAVKNSENAEDYLPMLTGQKLDGDRGKKLYEVFKEYAYFFPAVGRTIEGYSGLVFRKSPNAEYDNEEILNDITLDGQPLDDFSKEVFEETIKNYRSAIIVEYSEESKRAYMRMYKTLDILNWKMGYINGVYSVNFVVLQESVSLQDEDKEFEEEVKKQIRVLDIDENGYYRVRVYQKDSDNLTLSNSTGLDGYKIISTTNPMMNSQYMKFIPIFPISPIGQKWGLNYSPINDLSLISIVYYRLSAGHKNSQLLLGNPTPCLAGLQDDGTGSSVTLGSSRVLPFDTDGKWGFLSLGADGVKALKEDLLDLQKDMAVVGARILSSDPNGIESAETAQIHRSGEQSVLMSISKSVSRGLEKALKLVDEWTTGKLNDKISYSLTVDFNISMIDAQTMTALWTMNSSGAVSNHVFMQALKRGEIYPEGWTEKDEIKELKKDKKKKEAEKPVNETLDSGLENVDLEEGEEDEEIIEEEIIEEKE